MCDIDLFVKNDIENELKRLSKASLTSLNSSHSVELLKEAAEAIRTAVEKVSRLEEHIKCQIDAKNDVVSKSTSNDKTENVTANGPDEELRSEHSQGNLLEKETPVNRSASFIRNSENTRIKLYFDVNDPNMSKAKVLEAFAVHGLKPITVTKIHQREDHSYGFIIFRSESEAARALELSWKLKIDEENYFKIRPFKAKTGKPSAVTPTVDQRGVQEERILSDGLDPIINVEHNIRPRQFSIVAEEDLSINMLLPLEEVNGHSGRAPRCGRKAQRKRRSRSSHGPEIVTADTPIRYTNGRLDLPDIHFPKVSRANNQKARKYKKILLAKRGKKIIRKT